MQLGAIITGEKFDAVLHRVSPMNVYGHARIDGERCAFAYQYIDGSEGIVLASGAGFGLEELLSHFRRRGLDRNLRKKTRRLAELPADIPELTHRIEDLLFSPIP